MSGTHSSFIRLQTHSRISATQWKQWSDALGLETLEVEEVWDEIGHPIFTATRQLPPISFILQLRAERRQTNLFDFKEEIAPLLTFLNLLGQLKDDKLGGGKAIAILFRFFRIKVTSEASERRADALIEEFVVDLCKLILVARVIGKETITLSEVLNLVVRKKTPVDKVVELGMQALGSRPYANIFRRYLEGPPTAEEMAEWDEEDDSYEEEEGVVEQDEVDEVDEEDGEEEEEELEERQTLATALATAESPANPRRIAWSRARPSSSVSNASCNWANSNAVARASLSSYFVLKPERRRHTAQPRMPITVVSLEKLTGNADIRHLYLRVGSDGKVLYVEGYEDGTYTDLMELREYTQMRMQASNEGEEGSYPLQTGEKYLFTLGRTQDFFGGNASAILASCVRDEEGEIKIFPVFRPKVSH